MDIGWPVVAMEHAVGEDCVLLDDRAPDRLSAVVGAALVLARYGRLG